MTSPDTSRRPRIHLHRRTYDYWCCLCGEHDPDTTETCPVSEHEMGEGRGLKHMVASARYESAMDAWRSAAGAREALGITTEPPER